jgi:RNA polymerase sigma-70 factor, ECF subfamily
MSAHASLTLVAGDPSPRQAVDGAVVSDADTATFNAIRPRLFGIAYRVLGDRCEAEDVVQDAWIRWQTTDRSVVRDATAFLVTTTTRLALHVVQSARARRETSVGPQLVEASGADSDPTCEIERQEDLELAIRALLEKLSATERAALVLREAFDYRYRELGTTLHLSEANARQIVTRARRRLAGDCRRVVEADQHERLLHVFTAAAQTGELESLERMLSTEARGRIAA